jgi:VanZ family protein
MTALLAAVCVSALGIALEVAQLLLPGRWADPMDVLWMTLGAFVGAFTAAFGSMLLASLRPVEATSRKARSKLSAS